jgi:hypothetical protein
MKVAEFYVDSSPFIRDEKKKPYLRVWDFDSEKQVPRVNDFVYLPDTSVEGWHPSEETLLFRVDAVVWSSELRYVRIFVSRC